MKQLTITLACLLMLVTLNACKTTNLTAQDARQITAGHFDKVVVDGPMDVDLIGGIPENDVRLIGTKNDIYRVRAKVENETLYLTMLSGTLSKQRLLAVVRAPTLYQLSFKGDGRLKAIGLDAPWFNADIISHGQVDLSGKQLRLSQLNLKGSAIISLHNVTSRDLSIESTGSDKVNISGTVNLSKIRMAGTSQVKILWIDSPDLQVRSKGQSYLDLAGTVGTLDVMLRGQSRFNGRYLRSKYAYVKTYDSSRADLQVTRVQNALASQASNIYYYKDPEFQGTHMAQAGSVLDMDGMR